MFIDRVRIHAKAGNGGNGSASFRREKFIPKGGPDGGDGGDGGSIILRADPNVNQLAALYYQPIVKAKHGGVGSGRKKHGKNGASQIVPVPVGTMIYRLPTPDFAKPVEVEQQHVIILDDGDKGVSSDHESLLDAQEVSWAAQEEDGQEGVEAAEEAEEVAVEKDHHCLPNPHAEDLIADLDAPGKEFVLCAGGKGGLGNVHFKSSRNRAPRRFTEGKTGEEGWFLLEMRVIAFAGLVGYPNAGKSTLLGALSKAHPKIGSYAFTTRYPSVGVVDLGDYRNTTVADIPGLIEGASENRGLGHQFLRHIMRCPFLLMVLDIAGTEGRDPLQDFCDLRRELGLYDRRLLQRPYAVIANKSDMPEAEKNRERLIAFLQEYREDFLEPAEESASESLFLTRKDEGENEEKKEIKGFSKEKTEVLVIPLCAVLGEGVERIRKLLLEQLKAAGEVTP